VGGDKLSAVEAVPVPVVEPGSEVDIAVDMTAPALPGRYVGYYRLLTPDGTRFGQRVWVDVIVAPQEEKATEVAKEPAKMEVDAPAKPLYPVVNPAPATPAPSAAPAPAPAPVSMEIPVSPEHQQLLDMGFIDRELNVRLLSKNNNDVLRTVQELLQLPGFN